jgi:hypothetical protein
MKPEMRKDFQSMDKDELLKWVDEHVCDEGIGNEIRVQEPCPLEDGHVGLK